jgi:hypothetical protein
VEILWIAVHKFRFPVNRWLELENGAVEVVLFAA